MAMDSSGTTLPTVGGSNNTWGTLLNNLLETFDDFLGNSDTINSTGGVTALSAAQHQFNRIISTGTLSSNASFEFDGRGGRWLITNNMTVGAFSLTCLINGQTGVVIPEGETREIYFDGTDMAFPDTAGLPTTGGTMSGLLNLADNIIRRPVLEDYGETVNARGSISGAQTFNLTLGNVVTATITGATTLTFSEPPTSGVQGAFIFEVTNPGSNITWPGSVTWPNNGTAPTLTTTGVDVLVFRTVDGGTTWRGGVVGLDYA